MEWPLLQNEYNSKHLVLRCKHHTCFEVCVVIIPPRIIYPTGPSVQAGITSHAFQKYQLYYRKNTVSNTLNNIHINFKGLWLVVANINSNFSQCRTNRWWNIFVRSSVVWKVEIVKFHFERFVLFLQGKWMIPGAVVFTRNADLEGTLWVRGPARNTKTWILN